MNGFIGLLLHQFSTLPNVTPDSLVLRIHSCRSLPVVNAVLSSPSAAYATGSLRVFDHKPRLSRRPAARRSTDERPEKAAVIESNSTRRVHDTWPDARTARRASASASTALRRTTDGPKCVPIHRGVISIRQMTNGEDQCTSATSGFQGRPQINGQGVYICR